MAEHPHFESVRLENFTAFARANFDFVPGINVFVGENGMGKTHLMKLLYAWRLGEIRASQPERSGNHDSLNDIFQTSSFAELDRAGAASSFTVAGVHGGEEFSINRISLKAPELGGRL